MQNWRRIGAGATLVLAVLIVVAGARTIGWLEPLELAAYDALIRDRAAPTVGTEHILVVEVTEDDIKNLQTWPIPHGTLGEVLERLALLEPHAIGVDIYLDVPVPPGRDKLDAVLTKYDSIITAIKFGGGEGDSIGPAPVLADTDRLGFTDVIIDPGGAVRRGLLFLDDGENVATSLSLRVALNFLAANGVEPTADDVNPENMRIGTQTFVPVEASTGGYATADAGGYQYLLDYRESPAAFKKVTLTQVRSGDITASQVRDKVVLFGVTADSIKDVFFTPFSGGEITQTAGVVVHAHAVSQLLRGGLGHPTGIRTINDAQELLWIALWAALGGSAAFAFRGLLAFAAVLAAGLGLIVVAGWGSFVSWALWLPTVPALFGWGFSMMTVAGYCSAQERNERKQLMTLFSKHVSPQLAGSIWDQRDQFLRNGRPRPQRVTATVMFTDIAGFSTVSEALDPQELVDWLSEYMANMSPEVNKQNGVILRFIGDAIMAVFGVPVPRTSTEEIDQDAVNAVAAALGMRQKLLELNQSYLERGLPPIAMRVGIATGPMIAGTIGDADRLEYNVHGDIVNTAARLENYDKGSFVPDHAVNSCRIIISEVTAEHLHGRFALERMGDVELKGKHVRVGIHQVLGPHVT